MADSNTRRRSKEALGIVLLFLAYFATARLGLLLDAVAGFATLVWPPTGIALGALFLFGMRLWPGVLAGAVAVNLIAGASLPVALAIGAGNTLEALAGTWLLRRARFDPRLERLHDVLSLVLLGAICSTAISAAVGVLSLLAGGAIQGPMSWPALRAWWLGDMLGDLVVAPLLFVWASRPPLPRRPFMLAEAVTLAVFLAGCSFLVFAARHEGGLLRQAYVVFPALLWAALRFTQYGAVSAMFVVSTLAIAGTVRGLGPFERGTLAESLLHLQTFLAVAAATVLTVAAAIAERLRAVDARDEFLAIASHELRTPLTALLLHIQTGLRKLRRRGAPPGERDEALAQLESTQRLALRLGKLIGELLEVSRIVWGRFQPEREEVDLAAIVQESLVRQEQQLQNARCPVQLEVDGALRGHWDRARLDQLIDNLIGNAAKYGAGKPIEVRLQGREEDVLLQVRDHGIGIEPADQARVFERFERAVSRKQFGGFGLGLWISRQIVEAHGGSISLISEPGAGCTFSVELPRSQPGRSMG